ncbi:MAG TPA: tRNA (adenosine(37)-N6)-dimethylallyltransferase MiaA [Chitinophagaceae bacterium]|nr:tRNA (adenosine(37)-N6)-dimethylallyltransferase MiaA [Chitinophagaceae bacterium]
MQKQKTAIIIAGPTAVGKTKVAIDVAKQLGTEIISADSRQCYQELNIGVARPSKTELQEVPHHFIASHSILEKITAAVFEQWAIEKIHGLFKKFDTVVLTGGTGLYLQAFCEGFDAVPAVPENVRQELTESYKNKGLAWLQQQVQQQDPLFYAKGEIQNPQRLLRALEVITATGTSIETFKRGEKKTRAFKIVKTALYLPKETLHQNISHRVAVMMQSGLIDEVRGLLLFKQFNALQTVGYKEMFAYLDGHLNLDEAIEAIKRNTRHYAKRQLTWFKKDPAYHWFLPDASQLMHFIKSSVDTGTN